MTLARFTVAVLGLLAGCFTERNLGDTNIGSAAPQQVIAVGSARWALAIGGGSNDVAIATAIDSIGDVVVAGGYFGPADFGSGPVQGHGSFVTKRVASDGSERWTRVLVAQTASSYIDVSAAAIGADDSVIVAGEYVGTADFGGQTLTLNEPTPPDRSDTFVAKYSSSGDLLWVHGLSPNASSTAHAVVVDATGTIFVAGTFCCATLDFNGQQYTERDGDNDGFLFTLDQSGAMQWGRAFQGAKGPVPDSVAVASNGDVLVVGSFAAPATFGGATVDPAAHDRGFYARIRRDGLFLASGVIGPGGIGESIASQVAVDAIGDVVIQTIETDDLSQPDAAGVYVLDDNNNELWTARLDDSSELTTDNRALAAAPSGLIISSAWNDGPFNADHPNEVSGSMEIVGYDPSGTSGVQSLGARTYGSVRATLLKASSVSSTGATAFVGTFAGSVDFGTGQLVTHGQGDADAFVVLVDAPGT